MNTWSLRALLALTAGLLLALPVAGAGAQQTRIVNGTLPTQPWPAQTSVQHDPSTSVCGATLVSARWVLTAGHCVTNDTTGALQAATGFTLNVGGTSRTNGTSRDIDQVLRHPWYGGPAESPNYDVALLRLSAPVAQEPMALIGAEARDSEFWAPGVQATVIGWGYTETGAQSHDQLREAKVAMISDASCTGAWTTFNPATMVCAGGATTDACAGDSGGPLMVPRLGSFALVGVTSWGADRCACVAPGSPQLDCDARYGSPANPIKPGGYARLAAASISGWIKGIVPSLTIATSPEAPVTAQPVTLRGSPTVGQPTDITWDTNGDGAFGDAHGPEVQLSFPSAGAHIVQGVAHFPDGDRTAIARERVVVVDPPPPPPPPPAPPPAAPPPFAAKLEIARATVARPVRRLSVLAPITGRASGQVRAAFRAAGRNERFRATIDAPRRRVRIDRRIPPAQANLGTGILTLTYPGDSDTQPQEVRLRAAARSAQLRASRPRIAGGRLIAGGEISRRARGVVRLQLLFEPAGQQTRTVELTAPIRNGRYRFNVPLSAAVRAGIAQRRGVVHSYTLFTGQLPGRLRGEMRSFQVLGER